MKHLTRFFIILSAGFLIWKCSPDPVRIIGMKIYEYRGNYNSLSAKWKEMGVNMAFISTTLAANDSFRLALEENNIKVSVIFPVFQGPEILKDDSSLFSITNKGTKAKAEWVEFVCPSRADYRSAKIEELSGLIKKLKPDGISIDFIRQFVYWEKIYPNRNPQTIETACFCDSCLRNFCNTLGIAVPDTCTTTAKKAEWVTGNHPGEWETFSCNLISSMVKELTEKARLADPRIMVNVHIVPWREQDFDEALTRVAAQDLGKIAGYTDYISPMCYSQMLKRDAYWISDVVKGMDKQAHGMVLPSIQVYPEYIDQPFSSADFRECLIAALKPPSRGVVFFSWPLFEKDPERMEEVKKVTNGNN